MTKTDAAKWAYIFNTFGKANLRKMLTQAATDLEEQDRVVLELRENNGMDITEHVTKLESDQ